MRFSLIQKAILLRTAKTCAVFLLIGFYLFTGLRVTDLHRIAHDQEHTLNHSPAEESNLCHQTVYHAAAQACDHKFHITQDTSCALCDAIVHHSTHIADSGFTVESLLFTPGDESVHSLMHAAYTNHTSFDRGPPVT